MSDLCQKVDGSMWRRVNKYDCFPLCLLYFYSTPSTEGVKSVRLSICLSIITFSFSKCWMNWWLSPCKPYIFWKHITLVTSTTLFWLSTTKCQPVPPSTDPVFNDMMVYTVKPYIFWKHISLATSTALLWPSTTKYQPVQPVIATPGSCNSCPIYSSL